VGRKKSATFSAEAEAEASSLVAAAAAAGAAGAERAAGAGSSGVERSGSAWVADLEARITRVWAALSMGEAAALAMLQRWTSPDVAPSVQARLELLEACAVSCEREQPNTERQGPCIARGREASPVANVDVSGLGESRAEGGVAASPATAGGAHHYPDKLSHS
jgi:hypothetical protein